jgi:hypothetical protein
MTHDHEPDPDEEPSNLREKFGGLLLVIGLIIGVWRDKIATRWAH